MGWDLKAYNIHYNYGQLGGGGGVPFHDVSVSSEKWIGIAAAAKLYFHDT